MLNMFKIQLILLFTTLSLNNFVYSFQLCPKNWKQYIVPSTNKTKCLKTFYELVSRDEAQRRCRQLGNGFNLIEIHSKFENSLIVYTLLEEQAQFSTNSNEDMLNNYRPHVWIGPKRVPFGGIKDFQYSSGCGINDFQSWHKGQPNDYFNNEDCVYMYIDQYFMGLWADYNCDIKMYYICEFVTDLSPPCNQTNYNLFGYNENKNQIHRNECQNSTKGNGSVDRQKNRQNILNPFDVLNRLIDRIFRIRRIFRV